MISNSPGLTLPVGERDHIQGSFAAPAILVEYGDYECPLCGDAYFTLREVRQALGDKMAFVFRNFPLAEAHPHAKEAALAAEAAAAQGAFWPMHDLLFENPDEIARDDIARYAAALNLDVARLQGEIDSGAHAKRVQEDFRSGIRSGVNGTPTFFINVARYDGPRDAASLIAALTAAAEKRPL